MLTIVTIWLIFSSSNARTYMDFIKIQVGELPAVRYMKFLAGKYMGILKPDFSRHPCLAQTSRRTGYQPETSSWPSVWAWVGCVRTINTPRDRIPQCKTLSLLNRIDWPSLLSCILCQDKIVIPDALINLDPSECKVLFLVSCEILILLWITPFDYDFFLSLYFFFHSPIIPQTRGLGLSHFLKSQFVYVFPHS